MLDYSIINEHLKDGVFHANSAVVDFNRYAVDGGDYTLVITPTVVEYVTDKAIYRQTDLNGDGFEDMIRNVVEYHKNRQKKNVR